MTSLIIQSFQMDFFIFWPLIFLRYKISKDFIGPFLKVDQEDGPSLSIYAIMKYC